MPWPLYTKHSFTSSTIKFYSTRCAAPPTSILRNYTLLDFEIKSICYPIHHLWIHKQVSCLPKDHVKIMILLVVPELLYEETVYQIDVNRVFAAPRCVPMASEWCGRIQSFLFMNPVRKSMSTPQKWRSLTLNKNLLVSLSVSDTPFCSATSLVSFSGTGYQFRSQIHSCAICTSMRFVLLFQEMVVMAFEVLRGRLVEVWGSFFTPLHWNCQPGIQTAPKDQGGNSLPYFCLGQMNEVISFNCLYET